MSQSDQTPPWMFNLEGTFLGFLGDEPKKAKTISLEVEGELFAIKLPKELRSPLRFQVQPGDRLRCIGRSQLDDKGQTVKLRAYQVFALAPGVAGQPADALAIEPPPANAEPEAKRAKILICSKGGCKKRGGESLVTALKQALRDRNLHNRVDIQYTGCQKHCSKAPTFTIGQHRYSQVRLPRLGALLDRHFAPAKPNSPQP